MFRGVVYIAHFDRGVERLDGSQRTLVWPDESASARHREVVSVHAGGDHLCIGTAEAGVFFIDGKVTQTNPALDALIAGSLDDVLWLATARGLYAFKSGELLPIIERVDARWVVTETTRGAWCATVGGGLCKALMDENATTALVITSKTDAEQGLPSQNAFALFQESTNEGMWVGTNHGVARYQPAAAVPVLNATRVMAMRVYGLDELRAGLILEYPQNSLALEVAAMSSRTFSGAVSIFVSGQRFKRSTSHEKALGRIATPDRGPSPRPLLDRGSRVQSRSYRFGSGAA